MRKNQKRRGLIFLHTASSLLWFMQWTRSLCEDLFNLSQSGVWVQCSQPLQHLWRPQRCFHRVRHLGVNEGRPSTPNILQEATVDQTADSPHSSNCRYTLTGGTRLSPRDHTSCTTGGAARKILLCFVLFCHQSHMTSHTEFSLNFELI